VVWFVNGKVFTGAAGAGFANAFRVRDKKFCWVGVVTDRPKAEVGEEIVDLAGATVVPGLLDVHTHPAMMSTHVDVVSALPPAVNSIDALVQALRTSPAYGQGPEHWIEGFGFDDSGYPEGRQPTRQDLDRVSVTQPVFVRRCDGHTAVANSRALELAGITAQTPDPPGAEFGRDAAGVPNGQLLELAAQQPVVSLIPERNNAQRVTDVSRLAAHFASRGIVGVGDLFATMIDDPLTTFRQAAGRVPFPQTGLYLGWEHVKHDPPTLTDADRTGRVRIAGVKLLMDGAYSNRTAWTHDAYPDSCDHGLRTTTDEDLRAAVAWARQNRVQVAVHAMGDAALDNVVGLFEDDEPWMGDYPSIRLEHATLATRKRIERIANARMRFGVISHTIFFFAEFRAYERNLSAEQFAMAYPIRDYFDGLTATALASDMPATAWAEADDVFVSVAAAVRRRSHTGADIGQAQAISVPQALELYTSRAAAVMPMPGLGRIGAGGEASFVVLDRDIFTVPADEIHQVKPKETWIAAQRVYTAVT
jgi:predicted amidohydrolase YtcJ